MAATLSPCSHAGSYTFTISFLLLGKLLVPYPRLFHCPVSPFFIVKLFKSSVCGGVGGGMAELVKCLPCTHKALSPSPVLHYWVWWSIPTISALRNWGRRIKKSRSSLATSYVQSHSELLETCQPHSCKKELNRFYSVLLIGSFQLRVWFGFWLLFVWGFLFVLFFLDKVSLLVLSVLESTL